MLTTLATDLDHAARQVLALCTGHGSDVTECSCHLCQLHAALTLAEHEATEAARDERRWLVRWWHWERGVGPVKEQWLNYTRAEAEAQVARLNARATYLDEHAEIVRQEYPLIEEVSHDDVREVRGDRLGYLAGTAPGVAVPELLRDGAGAGGLSAGAGGLPAA